jgi:hypothetical protein
MSPSWLPIDFFRFHPAEKIVGRTSQLHTTRIFLGFTKPCQASRAALSQPSCDDHDDDHDHEEYHDDHDYEKVGEGEQQ